MTLFVLCAWLAIGLALRTSALRDTGRAWRPWALACSLSLAVACGAALAGCPPWDRPACGSPRSFVCVNDQPHVCSPSGRLTPIGDAPCAAVGGVCAIGDGGVAHCEVTDVQR